MWRTLHYDFGGTDIAFVTLTDCAHVIEIMADVEFGD
jgi:hypothetical protein